MLAIGPLPRSDSPVGGTQVSFSELVERLRATKSFQLAVLDTSRRATEGAGWRRFLNDASAMVSTLHGIVVRAPRCDVVLFNASSGATLLVGPLIALTCRALCKPLAVRVFGGDLDLVLERSPKWRRSLVERTVLRAPLVLLQTRALCQKFGDGRNTRQLATTRDVPAVERAPSPRCTRFLFLSQLRPEKGFADAIAAIERSPAECTLTVAGPSLSALDTRTLQASARVRYIGAVEPRDVPRVFAEHDALLFPSRHEGEGLPGVVIEALQSGVPVIATRWRSLPEIVEHERNGLLVEPGSIDELAAAIERLARDGELFQRLAIGALHVGERFRAGPWHTELEAWLLDLCARANRRPLTSPQPATALPRPADCRVSPRRQSARRTEAASVLPLGALHILFLSDNFPPETNAPATRLFEHARCWVRAGHRVTVITCAPNFPEGRVYAGYRNRWRAREVVDGIEVIRVKTFIAANRGVIARICDYLSFMVAGFAAGLFVRKPDVIVGTSPQFFAAVGAWALAFVRRKPFVFELRDLWPESIRAVGAMKPSLALAWVEQLELFLYRRAAAVVAVTESFREDLVRRGIARDKIAVVHNGVDLSRYRPQTRDSRLARELGVDGKFVVGYFGTHGLAHALERVLEAAELLRERTDVHFLFVGAGAARDGLVRAAAERKLDNVSLFPSRPKDDMPRLWSICDVGLVHLKNTPTFASVVPSKIFECFGSGVPVLYAGPDGEGARIVRDSGAGIVVDAEHPAKLAEAVLFLAGDPELCRDFACLARASAARFDRGVLAERMLRVLEECAGFKGTPSERENAREPQTARKALG